MSKKAEIMDILESSGGAFLNSDYETVATEIEKLYGGEKKKVKIKKGWEMAGRVGLQLGNPVLCGQLWTPVLWNGFACEDPEFHKTAGLEEIKSTK